MKPFRKNKLSLIEYKKAFELDPYLGRVYYNRSLIVYDLNEKPNALTDILKTIEFGIKVDPRHIKWLQKE